MAKFPLRLPVAIGRILPVLRRGIHLVAQTLRLMVGVGDYAVYLEHMQKHHPDMAVLGHDQWFRARVDARYGVSKDGAVKRCPC